LNISINQNPKETENEETAKSGHEVNPTGALASSWFLASLVPSNFLETGIDKNVDHAQTGTHWRKLGNFLFLLLCVKVGLPVKHPFEANQNEAAFMP
jgi:hypothetical protein